MAESGNFSDQEKALEYVKSLIRPFPDFPQPGILFRWDFSLQLDLGKKYDLVVLFCRETVCSHRAAGARYIKWIASLQLRHKERNNDP